MTKYILRKCSWTLFFVCVILTILAFTTNLMYVVGGTDATILKNERWTRIDGDESNGRNYIVHKVRLTYTKKDEVIDLNREYDTRSKIDMMHLNALVNDGVYYKQSCIMCLSLALLWVAQIIMGITLLVKNDDDATWLSFNNYREFCEITEFKTKILLPFMAFIGYRVEDKDELFNKITNNTHIYYEDKERIPFYWEIVPLFKQYVADENCSVEENSVE